MSRLPSDQAKFRRAVFAQHRRDDPDTGRVYLVCHICGIRIDPVKRGWHADHVIPRFYGGSEGKPACIPCHTQKTATVDVPAIAKTKRLTDQHYRVKPKGWGGKFRKKMNGEVVLK